MEIFCNIINVNFDQFNAFWRVMLAKCGADFMLIVKMWILINPYVPKINIHVIYRAITCFSLSVNILFKESPKKMLDYLIIHYSFIKLLYKILKEC